MDARLGAHGGCLHVSNTSANAGFFFGFVPDQDTVVAACTGVDQAGTPVNYLTEMGISGKTLKIGSYFAVPTGHVITSFQLTSGAVVLYKQV